MCHNKRTGSDPECAFSFQKVEMDCETSTEPLFLICLHFLVQFRPAGAFFAANICPSHHKIQSNLGTAIQKSAFLDRANKTCETAQKVLLRIFCGLVLIMNN